MRVNFEATDAIGKEHKRAAHGYEATREQAMAAFAKSWRRGSE